MADVPVFHGSKTDTWQPVPAAVVGTTWRFQNCGRFEARLFVTDGAAPADDYDGELMPPESWSPSPVLLTAGEVVYVRGISVRLFMREVA